MPFINDANLCCFQVALRGSGHLRGALIPIKFGNVSFFFVYPWYRYKWIRGSQPLKFVAIERQRGEINRAPNEELLQHQRKRITEMDCAESEMLMEEKLYPKVLPLWPNSFTIRDKYESKLKQIQSEVLASHPGPSSGISQQMRDEFAVVLEKVETTTDQKMMLQKELEQARTDMAELQREDYPKQISEEEIRPVMKKAPPSPREYCDCCQGEFRKKVYVFEADADAYESFLI
ncbi:unnamed protein product [Cylicostephanus goldi]|uniref:Uncharacterized protein n=1 Tax=Cylicostephanus goldi TaxID=71465 RepID=A0A3P7MF39_CYLGO|nr:unnamed protein product [Cylicostephanus goldi]